MGFRFTFQSKEDNFMETIYIDSTNRVTVTCPKCGIDQNLDTANFKDSPKTLKGRCKCGEPYEFNIEFRKRFRKDVELPGQYAILGRGEKEDILIRELSLTGIQFESRRPHYIVKDDTLEVTFRLDNHWRSKIRKLVKVIWVLDFMVGAEYIESKLFEPDLEFYLKQ
jgi:hypothetical protein